MTINVMVLKAGWIYGDYYVPPHTNPYDGIMAISQNVSWNEIELDTKKVIPKSRASVVFHELSENYYRVQGNGYWDAHNCAINDEKLLPSNDIRRSKKPGAYQ
jgi:hypothetical protein